MIPTAAVSSLCHTVVPSARAALAVISRWALLCCLLPMGWAVLSGSPGCSSRPFPSPSSTLLPLAFFVCSHLSPSSWGSSISWTTHLASPAAAFIRLPPSPKPDRLCVSRIALLLSRAYSCRRPLVPRASPSSSLACAICTSARLSRPTVVHADLEAACIRSLGIPGCLSGSCMIKSQRAPTPLPPQFPYHTPCPFAPRGGHTVHNIVTCPRCRRARSVLRIPTTEVSCCHSRARTTHPRHQLDSRRSLRVKPPSSTASGWSTSALQPTTSRPSRARH
jgi:hypothetical protein